MQELLAESAGVAGADRRQPLAGDVQRSSADDVRRNRDEQLGGILLAVLIGALKAGQLAQSGQAVQRLGLIGIE